jgi:uncharacterized membrane protein
MLALALLGVAIATYLTYVHYSGAQVACTAGQSCVKVQTSQWSRLVGVPVALIGLVGYLAIVASLVAPEREESRLATLVLTLGGFAFSAYLTYRELFSIHAICEWCVSSAVIMTLLLAAAATRYVSAPTTGGAGVRRSPHSAAS